jgi:lipid II:glycine glycyltransferase (peptidoglycan interpeptide bridge formation enzyme)
MGIGIEKYNKKNLNDWEDFVKKNGTIFHSINFLDYHESPVYLDSLLFRKNNNLIAVLPGKIEKERFISPYGATYGGFVTPIDIQLKDAMVIVEKLLDYVNNQGISNVKLTLSPSIYQKTTNNYIEFSLMKNRFSYITREIENVIHLFGEVSDLLWWKKKTRNQIRKAQNYFKVKESKDINTYYNILLKNKNRHEAKPTHKLEELKELMLRFPNEIKLFAVFSDERMVAGSLIFLCNSRVALTFYIAHLERYSSQNPVNLLIYNIAIWCKINGFKYLNLGTSTKNMEPRFPLVNFKENNNAIGIFRDTLRWNK